MIKRLIGRYADDSKTQHLSGLQKECLYVGPLSVIVRKEYRMFNPKGNFPVEVASILD